MNTIRIRSWRGSCALTFAAGLVGAIFVPTDRAQATGATTADKPTGREEMVLIGAGSFDMGFDDAYEDERPTHRVSLMPFYLDRHEVTNETFSMFVQATGYITQAERNGGCWCYLKDTDSFQYVTGADWRHPLGPASSRTLQMTHPVACVSWNDASAYAQWAGKRLPTEAEWEYAARSGKAGQFVADTEAGTPTRQADVSGHGHHHPPAGADQSPSSKSHSQGQDHSHGAAFETKVPANVWQGTWPTVNNQADGYFYTSPAGTFAPNEWGLSDMLGNVWEWTADWYAPDYYDKSPASNPGGPDEGEKRVARGGSWFCSPNYCGAYNSHYRGASPPDRSFNNVGFRCAADAGPGLESDGRARP